MPDELRPDPDALLEQASREEGSSPLGKLRLFFGYAAGVGKTYAMLESAHLAAAQGRDVVVGYIEPHARPDTQSLVKGLEVLPTQLLEYRGVRLREFDLDAALKRNPEVLLVDELAHTNVHGCRHEKRWQDIQELLAAGIHVWTTMNVQHIESLNDVIGQITGIVVQETVPDRVFDSADEIELVDVTPDELLARLQAGKVYLGDQARRAIQNFFQKSNLQALRELSLRQAAQRIHTDVESARRAKAADAPWATAERLLVCIGPSPTTARVIRTAKRLAAALDARWYAVSVDVDGEPPNSAGKRQTAQHFRLAERLGAETLTLAGQRVAPTIIDFCRSKNVTKILIGKTHNPIWRRLLFGSIVDEIIESSGKIDVYVIHGQPDEKSPADARPTSAAVGRAPMFYSALAVAFAGTAARALNRLGAPLAEADVVMLFLAAVAWSAFRFGRGPAVFASIVAVCTFDFFFVPPYLTFAVADAKYAVTFGVMLTIALVISALTSRLRAQVENARRRERRTAALYELGKQLSSLYGDVFLVSAAAEKISELLGGQVAVYLKSPTGAAELSFGHNNAIAKHPVSQPAAQWVIEHDQIAGAGTNTLPNAAGLFLPLTGSQGTHGAVAIQAPDAHRLLEPDQRRLLEACAGQLALALERDRLVIEAADARIQAEAELVRSSLLSSVSHDLRTPLAAIAGASSSLLESASIDEQTRQKLLETVAEEATRLNRLLENILQMSKLDAGAAPPNCQWHVFEEIVGSALRRTSRELAGHSVHVRLAPDLPLVWMDGLLMEQVLVNLLENAARYTPPGTEVVISAAVDGKAIRIAVADNGPGLPEADSRRVFEKFYRGVQPAYGTRGSGLGLAICSAIAKAHGGSIHAVNRPGGGCEFIVRLPLADNPPQVPVE